MAVGVSGTTVKNWEGGEFVPHPLNVAAYAAALDVSPAVITGQLPGIAALRTAAGITPDDLAEHVGITVDRLRRIEQGHETPDTTTTAAIARHLAVDPAVLASPEEEAA